MADNLNSSFNLASNRGLPSRILSNPLVKLLTHRCTIACANCLAIGRFHFCGTVHTLTRSGRYPAICPWMPGLSSLDYSSAIIRLLYVYSLTQKYVHFFLFDIEAKRKKRTKERETLFSLRGAAQASLRGARFQLMSRLIN